MIALAGCIRDNWHAVERDLISLNLSADDIGTPKLTLCQLISIVLAAPPGSAVHYFEGRWSRTDELLANFSEQQAGLINLNARYPRPQVDSTPARRRTAMDDLPNFMGQPLSAMPVDEFTVKLRERQQQLREGK